MCCSLAPQVLVDQSEEMFQDRQLPRRWGLRAFGDVTKARQFPEGASPRRNFTDVHLVAMAIRRFDVAAAQEARGNLRTLRHRQHLF